MNECKALLFDCYGTLIDWEQGFLKGIQPILSQQDALDAKHVISVIGKHESAIQAETPSMLYPKVLEEAYHRCAGELGLRNDPEAARLFGASVGSWDAFPDSADALTKLRRIGLKLVILSNVDRDSFNETRKKLESAGTSFDAVYVAQDIGSYKPNLKNFQYAFDHLKSDFAIRPDEILSVANSKFHDVEPAHKVGIECAWINRPNAIMGVQGRGETPDYEFPSMAAFAEEMGRVRS